MDEDYRTLWCGNLSDSITEELLFELFLQAAPLERVRIPQDRTGRKSNYAFIVLKHSKSVPYVVDLLNGISVYDKKLIIKPRQPNQSNIRDRLGPKVGESPRNDNMIPIHADALNNMYFQGLFHLGQMMNVVPVNSPHIPSPENRHNNQRNRNVRRGENKIYNRHDRYGRNVHSYENQRRHRHY
ncbi:hypothetical protein WA026_015799 [Henosepilachna vigintioctopunctata]|uniref:RRM domain-containing protein n=1 Tax=Henosepilachna vigintioctopunctata TaxID=420089 RepID=A0AAW1UYW1_9CUCU